MTRPGPQPAAQTVQRILIAIVLLLACGVIAWLFIPSVPEGPGYMRLAQGRAVYDANCASCHGARLQGEPDWQTPGPDGFLPAPPLDATGHGWEHPDSALMGMIRSGYAPGICGVGESKMPAFAGLLSEDDMTAALDYAKSTWTESQRTYQRETTEIFDGDLPDAPPATDIHALHGHDS